MAMFDKYSHSHSGYAYAIQRLLQHLAAVIPPSVYPSSVACSSLPVCNFPCSSSPWLIWSPTEVALM
jgi:hypothetical protein